MPMGTLAASDEDASGADRNGSYRKPARGSDWAGTTARGEEERRGSAASSEAPGLQSKETLATGDAVVGGRNVSFQTLVDKKESKSGNGRRIAASTSGSKLPAPCVISKLEFTDMLDLIDQEPKESRRFFVGLAAGLSERLNTRSGELRSAVRSIGSQSAFGLAGSVGSTNTTLSLVERSADDLADAFELPPYGDGERMLLASSECVVSLEQSSQHIWREVPARLYLLSSHLCVEKPVLHFWSERKAIPLTDVFGLLDRRGSGGGGTDGNDSFIKRTASSGGAVVSVQIKSGSMAISLPSGAFDDVVREIEIARLPTLQTSRALRARQKRKRSWPALETGRCSAPPSIARRATA